MLRPLPQSSFALACFPDLLLPNTLRNRTRDYPWLDRSIAVKVYVEKEGLTHKEYLKLVQNGYVFPEQDAPKHSPRDRLLARGIGLSVSADHGIKRERQSMLTPSLLSLMIIA